MLKVWLFSFVHLCRNFHYYSVYCRWKEIEVWYAKMNYEDLLGISLYNFYLFLLMMFIFRLFLTFKRLITKYGTQRTDKLVFYYIHFSLVRHWRQNHLKTWGFLTLYLEILHYYTVKEYLLTAIFFQQYITLYNCTAAVCSICSMYSLTL